MANADDLRNSALALPGTTEGTHFRLPSFRVSGKGFAGLQKNGTHAILLVDKPSVHALVSEAAAIFEEAWQSKRFLIGVRVELAAVTARRLQQLVELAWRNKAPKKVVTAFD